MQKNKEKEPDEAKVSCPDLSTGFQDSNVCPSLTHLWRVSVLQTHGEGGVVRAVLDLNQ
jgi:hypothetical protein